MGRLLLIDDDPAILNLEKAFLLDAGLEVLTAESAIKALDLLNLYKVDLIIVDIQMPRLNGFQFVETIRKNPELSKIPIAFLSASEERQDVLHAAKLGADFYILKPFTKSIFLERVSAIFKKHPPKTHPKVIFEVPKSINTKITTSIQVTAVSEVGVEVLTNQSLEMGQIMELPQEFFNQAFIQNPLFEVFSIAPGKNGFNKVFLILSDRSEKSVKRFKKYVSTGGKSLPATYWTYPKSKLSA